MKLLLSTLALVLSLFLALRLAPSSVADTTPVTPDTAHFKALYTEKCSACHNLPDPVAEAMTRAEWQRTVRRMLVKYKASDEISEPEAAQIVSYLATFAPRPTPQPGGVNGQHGPSWDTDAGDVWPAPPTASRIQTFENSGALASLSLIQEGAPAHWHVAGASGVPDGMYVKVNPTVHASFAALVDPHASGRDVDVRVRFQVIGGRAGPAAGIIFGASDARNFYVLRCDARADTLSVIKVSGEMHTALQTTPISLPDPNIRADGVQAAALAPQNGAASVRSLAPGWHTLRLMARNGFLRGWIDMQKRVSIHDDTYAGGQVGLWTGGDTIAAFDDWTTDVYDASSDSGSGRTGGGQSG